jgi:hypothetical protein
MTVVFCHFSGSVNISKQACFKTLQGKKILNFET